jgi:Leucine-rich repeat (LRR) protein
VTDAGLKELAGLKLKYLSIPDRAKTELGLKHYLAALEAPTNLSLQGWQLTDAGLKELAGLTSLQSLYLDGTQVTDAGLKELAGLTSLQTLVLNDTEVTDAGIAELRKALPDCRIIR